MELHFARSESRFDYLVATGRQVHKHGLPPEEPETCVASRINMFPLCGFRAAMTAVIIVDRAPSWEPQIFRNHQEECDGSITVCWE
jgi:hypothetical protein